MRKIIYGLLFSLLLGISGAAYSYSFYGPTFENEHLYRIALRVRPNPGLTIPQVMVAVLNANRSAFNQNNINGLKSGYRLRIPPAPIIANINPMFALDTVNHQNKIWVDNIGGTKTAKHKRKHSLASKEDKTLVAEKTPSKQEDKEPAKSTVMDIANQQHATTKTSVATLSEKATPVISSDQAGNQSVPSDNSAIANKMTGLIDETKKFEEQTNLQLAKLQQQTATLQAKVSQLTQDLQKLTYSFVQLSTKTNHNQKQTTLLLEGLKQNALGLSLGLLALILLTYLLKRAFRRSPKGINKKDEYDYMSSKESIPSKLDLARAYMDMGDFSAAESALKEVMARGNEVQRQGARELMGQMNTR